MSLLDYDGLNYHTGRFKTWVKKLLEGKSNTGHTHDDRYYTESEINTKLNGKANSSHTHGNGDITSLDASKITSGTISIDRLPQGALERLTVVADDTARFKLTSSTIQKGDTVKVTSTGKMYYIVDETKLSSEAGYEVYAAGTAASVPWSGVTGKPSTYAPSSHTHSYLPLSGGTLTGNLTLNRSLFIKNQFYQNTLDGYVVASLVSTEATTNTDNETRLTLGSSPKNRPGKIQLYNNMRGSATFRLTDGGSSTYDLYLPCTSGTLTTSAGKSATYTSSLSSGSDTLFTQAGAYAMYSELNSNLDILLSITTNNFDYVANFENADNAPQGIRKGQAIIGHPSRFGEWVMYQTYYYDASHQYGWQLALNMNGNGIAYRYRRNSTWNDWAYLVLES